MEDPKTQRKKNVGNLGNLLSFKNFVNILQNMGHNILDVLDSKLFEQTMRLGINCWTTVHSNSHAESGLQQLLPM